MRCTRSGGVREPPEAIDSESATRGPLTERSSPILERCEGTGAADPDTSEGSSVKIIPENDPHVTRLTPRASGRVQPGKAATPQDVTVSGQSDGVELSDRAQELRLAKQAAAGAPDVRSEIVTRLKLRIRNDAFKIDAGMIAERLAGGS